MGVSWFANKTTGDPTLSANQANLPNPAAAPGVFAFGTVRSGFNISMNLQMLESHKKGKIISRPRIATASGVAAEINEVENVVIATQTQTIGLGGVVQFSTTYTTVALPIDLRVTPRITDDGRITTVINASITSQSGPALSSSAPPPTNVQTANTTITTKNGETIVIGGMVREIAQETVNGLPILSSIPILGDLFKSRDKSNRREELVIFITPTIMED